MARPAGGRGPVSGGRKVLVALGLVLVLALGAGAAGALWFRSQSDPSGPPGEVVTVQVPQGASAQRIAGILANEGIIESASAFRLYVRTKGGGSFKAGEYQLRERSSFDEVVKTLEAGPEITFQRLTIPEGLILTQIADRVATLPGRSAEAFLAAAKSGEVTSRYQPAGSTNLEGLLFPDTYNFEESDDEAEILRRMVSTFDAKAAAAGIDDVGQGGLVDPYQAIVVASLIEREAKVPEDRGMVSRVIYNRLKADMLLQVDASVIYALGRTGERGLRVLFKDLEVDSPYNTYKVKGLPPAPIAAPGLASLEAAVSPTPGAWLYYVVVDADGRHAFGTTLAEHNRNIAAATRAGVR
ncbi:MAG: endolytic transglycosylase MltG [Acidimicrobiales bacterium]